MSDIMREMLGKKIDELEKRKIDTLEIINSICLDCKGGCVDNKCIGNQIRNILNGNYKFQAMSIQRKKDKEKIYAPFKLLAKKWLGVDYWGNPRCDKEHCGDDLLDLVRKEMEKS